MRSAKTEVYGPWVEIMGTFSYQTVFGDLVLVANAMDNAIEVYLSVLEASEVKCRPTTHFRATVV